MNVLFIVSFVLKNIIIVETTKFILLLFMNDFQIIKCANIDSTNVYAKALMSKEHLEEGTTVWAMNQFAGKGLGNNRWYCAESKSLAFSMIFYPVFLDLDHQFTVSMAVSLGVIDFLHQYSANIAIKWPNDIYYTNKKLGGILIENLIKGNRMKYSIVGVGLNIKNIDFPAKLPNPISLESFVNKKLVLEYILKGVCNAIIKRYEALKKGSYTFIKEAYLQHLMGYNEEKMYKYKDIVFPARVIDVEMNGHIVLKGPDGNTGKYFFKQIEMIN